MKLTSEAGKLGVELDGKPAAEYVSGTLYILRTLGTAEFKAVTGFFRKHVDPDVPVKRKPKNPAA